MGKKKTIIEEEEIFIDIEIDQVDSNQIGKVSPKDHLENSSPGKTDNHQLIARGGGVILILIL